MHWLKTLLMRRATPSQDPAVRRAAALLAAVDAGGLPLHPARANDIARRLGLPVSSAEKVSDTIDRIRAALAEPRR